ncbi:uncharacterized protein LOC142335830 [Convolutriloba macropyga]|uniref:uncharacterized protein LOC142335830 n=1 Tax=Convolutriloba macropyga TaxID=536237 RepID=UPI003F523259
MFVASSPLETNSTLSLFGRTLPIILGTFVVQDRSEFTPSLISDQTYLYEWYVLQGDPDLLIELNSTYHLDYKGSGTATTGDLLLSECPENGDNLLHVFHFINNTFQNDSDNFVPSAPSTFPDDSVLLDPYTHNLTFEHWIVLDWVGASQCHVTYMRDIRDSLSGVVDNIIWFSDYDEWTGNVEHFQSEADLINERKAQLRVAVETNHSGPENGNTNHIEFVHEMDRMIEEMDVINWVIKGLLQDNISETYHILAKLYQTEQFKWSNKLLDETTEEHSQMTQIVESQCQLVQLNPRYLNPMAAYCEVKEFRKARLPLCRCLNACQGSGQETRNILLQEASDVIMYAAIEPPQVYWQNAQFMLWMPLWSLFTFILFLLTMSCGLSVFYHMKQWTAKAAGFKVRGRDADTNASEMVREAKERRRAMLERKHRQESSSIEMTIY